MSDTSLKAVSALFQTVTPKAVSKSGTGNFNEVFDMAAQSSNDQSVSNPLPETGKSRPEFADKRPESMRETEKSNQVTNVDVAESPEDEAMAKAEELIGEVARELGISVEEVEKAMEVLGIAPMDLFTQTAMTELVLTLSGSDMTALLTDEGLYQSLQGLLDISKSGLESLQAELGMSEEDLKLLLDSMAKGNPEEAVPEEPIKQPVTEAMPDTKNGQPEEIAADAAKTDQLSTAINADTDKAEVKSQDAGDQSVDQISQQMEAAKEGSEQKESAAGKDNPFQRDNVFTNFAPQNVTGQDPAVPAAANFSETIAGRSVSPNDIMNQIMDSMRVQVRADITQMQIQLHPASLGTININISSKDGVISAQFMAQNEAVKQVIESQIVQLKNQFEEQGLKVEAVEVTVESHKFERNLSGQNEQQQDNTHGKKKNGHRRINLDAISAEETEALDESEQIAVELMNMNGSSVDFTA